MRRRRLFGAGLVGVLILVILPAAPAGAITINFCGTNDQNVALLIDAFERANDEATNPGSDTINLPRFCEYTLSEVYLDKGLGEKWGLPQITSSITLNANFSVIKRQDPDSEAGIPGHSFGFFDVTSTGGLVIQDLALRNGAGSNGGFISNAGFILMVDSFMSDNHFGNNDSAIVNKGSGHLTLLRTEMRNHDLLRDQWAGAIDNVGDLFLIDSEIKASEGFTGGGAITNRCATTFSDICGRTEIWNSDISGNRAASGGAISNGGELIIHDSELSGNHAEFGGAIANESDLVVEGSYFRRNEARLRGGAIDSDALVARVTNSTFDFNKASSGGAIYNHRAIRVEHSTFAENVADPAAGEAIFTDEESGTSVAEANIFKGSGAQCGGDAPIDFGANVVFPSGSGCPAGFTVGDPKLEAPAALNGGSTLNFALGAGSAAIDLAGSCTDPEIDQRGKARPAGPGCDSGAFEDQVPSVPSTPVLSAGTNPNNTGEFTLDWNDATDPDGEAPTYRLYHKDADDSGFSRIASPTSSHFVFDSLSPESEGTHRYRVESFDGNHASVLLSQSGAIVVDKTAPTIPTALADRAPDYQPDGDNGWYVSPVTVTIGGSSDPALDDASGGSGVASYTAPQTFTTSGLHRATGTATDGAGNISPATTLDVQVDADPPVVAFDECPAEVILGSTASLQWTATDAHSGLATSPAGVIPIDTSAIGPQSLSTPVAADNVGLTSFVTCNFNVVYDFAGFFQPIDNAPAFNEVRAGQTIPISFSLNGDHGLDVIAPDFPASEEIPCGESPELTEGMPTMTTPQGLTFSPGRGGRYDYPWRTEREWAGTCRQFILLLDDGTFHRANFIFI